MTRAPLLALAACAALLAAPALADEADGNAVRRLRACLVTGASQPYTSLREAVIGTRAYCGAQIGRERARRVAIATAGLTGPAAEQAASEATRKLDAEIAQAVANFTGLKP